MSCKKSRNQGEQPPLQLRQKAGFGLEVLSDLSSVECSCHGWLEVGLVSSLSSTVCHTLRSNAAGRCKQARSCLFSHQALSRCLTLLVSKFRCMFHPQVRSQSMWVSRPSRSKLLTSPGLRRNTDYTACALLPELLQFILILGIASVMYWLCPGKKWAVFHFT